MPESDTGRQEVKLEVGAQALFGGQIRCSCVDRAELRAALAKRRSPRKHMLIT